MVRILTILMLFVMVGCASDPFIQTNTVYVDVPVNVCPAPILIDRPLLPTSLINSSTSSETVVKSYKQTIKILQNYSIKLEQSLNTYKELKAQ